ncbi:VPA1262 family N-terminal domain-containing protein [Salibacter halophilus]|uniref:Phospholipase D-like domain-containing protein n=1 Tax=Salibacter halophilus TaxID=1803916 RepID=A0A6N6M4G0_9FLAO|nr:VPA1262 family N-terminal domain-containing protein [Salibacter halophilus]KAB1064074.1 hypothetical protein F3059_08560 [Salibacter halophilus]
MIQKLKTHYKKAFRTTLLAQDKLTKKWYHLFSVIELQTDDEYPYNIPNNKWKDNCVRTKQSGLDSYSFYLAIDEFSSVDRALNVFSNPINNFEIDGKEISFFNKSFIKEPSGEYPLVFTSNYYSEKGVASIVPVRKSGLLIWCQIDNERKTENQFISLTTSKETQAIQQLTIDWLGFDIIQKREHIGNVYLSAPNPYFREINLSLSTNPIGIFYKILTRKKHFEPLTFRIIDKHGDAIALDKAFKINDQEGLINLPHEPNSFELRIYNRDNNLIALQGPSTFIKSIKVGISLKQADLQVNKETEKGSEKYVIEKFSRDKPLLIGETKNFNSEHYFKNADKTREHIELANRSEFIFFPGAKSENEKAQLREKAKSEIRKIINKAEDTCYLCDPYFRSIDIVDYAFHIKNTGIKINILNSKEAILKINGEVQKINETLETYNSNPFSDIEVHSLRGKSILHDRFIITDEKVWFIGSSFNEFGNRATCIARIPDSSGRLIIKEIEKWYNSDSYSQNIIEYAKNI